MPSHHRPHGAHETPRRRLRPEWIALVTLAALAASCACAWALAGGRASAGPDNSRLGALTQAITQADQLGTATGKLPAGACAQQDPTRVICTSPVPGVAWAVFQTYPSLPALYHAYEQRVAAMHSGPFIQNAGDCGLMAPSPAGSEVAWNHEFQHPRRFSTAEMSTGRVPEAAAAGRVYCMSADGAQEEMAWTQDNGRMLGLVAGSDHEAVWEWWSQVHHNIVLGGPAMPMAPAG